MFIQCQSRFAALQCVLERGHDGEHSSYGLRWPRARKQIKPLLPVETIVEHRETFRKERQEVQRSMPDAPNVGKLRAAEKKRMKLALQTGLTPEGRLRIAEAVKKRMVGHKPNEASKAAMRRLWPRKD